jgi:hypothetical protein
MTAATCNRLYFASFLILLPVGWGAVLSLAVRQPGLPPELKELKVNYEQIRPEMTEKDIDVVFAGYGSSKSDFKVEGPHDHPLSQLCSFVKVYEKQVSREGDYGVVIYFDYFGHVVDKDIAAYEH